ncbi:hypothetical protein GOP47_0028006 [Adiantum capillus-veneris]|nr:hypothetical protein GOP47_0028006 [Adiantum capillus-veneris]
MNDVFMLHLFEGGKIAKIPLKFVDSPKYLPCSKNSPYTLASFLDGTLFDKRECLFDLQAHNTICNPRSNIFYSERPIDALGKSFFKTRDFLKHQVCLYSING